MPSATTEDALSEALPFLYDIPFRRPYQAYCVTEASSRPSSPDPIVPKPLRTSAPPLSQTAVNTELAETGESEQNNSCIRAATSSPEQFVESVTLRKTGQYSKRQTSPPNREPLWERTKSEKKSNHITQAVTPRGSYSLASPEVIAYDRPPSHPRMQQLKSANKAAIHSVLRKPIERHGDCLEAYQRPLPPLPLEPASVGFELSQEDNAWSGKAYIEACEQLHAQPLLALTRLSSSDTEASRQYKPIEHLKPRRPLPVPPVETTPSLSSRSTTSEDKTAPQSLTEHSNDVVFCESSLSLREHDVFNSHPQDPAATELYVPRGHWGYIDDDELVPRRMRTKYAKLEHQFRQLPSQHSALPPVISQQSNSYLQPVNYFANPAPSFHSSTDIQNGPRPPPWGSYEDLEIQRHQRVEARERAKIHATRLTTDCTSTYRKSHSTDSLGKDPLKEVEDYREQILGVYPDMEFIGDAGRGDRRWCCCVVM